jgi:hypothetical protein
VREEEQRGRPPSRKAGPPNITNPRPMIAARRRAMAEYPQARREVQDMRDRLRYHFYFKRLCGDYDVRAVARAVGAVDRGSA